MVHAAQEDTENSGSVERFAALEKAVRAEMTSPAGGKERGPSVRVLLKQAEEAGFSRDEGKQRLAEALDEPGVHGAWTHWTAVEDKDELRLRLEMVRRFSFLPESVLDFVFFFFRASDPALYQPAALALGSHWKQGGELRRRASGYAEERGADLTREVRLNGARSGRRLFLLQVAASPGAEKRDFVADPLPGFLESPPALPGDFSTGLLGADFRLAAEEEFEKWRGEAQYFLEKLSAGADREWDRITVQRWSRLWVRLAGGGARRGGTPPVELWLNLLQNRVERLRVSHLQAGGRIHLFLQIDELLRAVSFLPDGLAKECQDQLADCFGDETRFFLRLRLDLWRRRLTGGRGGFGEPPVIPDRVSPEAGAGYLSVGYADPKDFLLSGQSDSERSAALLDHLLKSFESRERWLALSCERKALAAFLLFDQTMNSPLSAERLEAIFRARGFPAGSAAAARVARGGDGSVGFATEALLLRLVAWEPPGVEVFLDARLLHQIEDEEVLLALLREKHPGGLLSVLADAFEHRLRVRLAREEGFSVPEFLYRTTIRRPHSGFYRAFRGVVLDRAYLDPAGKTVPLAEMLARLEAEAALLEEGKSSELPAETAPFSEEEALGLLLRRLRTDLKVSGGGGDPRAGVEAFARLARGDADEGSGERPGLLQLIGRVDQGGRFLARSGSPALSNFSLEELGTELRQEMGRALELARALQPSSVAELSGGKASRFALAQLLRRQRAHLAPLLPAVEAGFLEEGLEDLIRRVEAWDKELEAVAQVALRAKDSPAGQSEVFDAIAGVKSAPLRAELLRLHARGPEAASRQAEEDRWHSACDRLAWGLEETRLARLSADEREVWLEEQASAWSALLRESMEARFESRVIALVRDPAFEEVRRHPVSTPSLEQARTWLLDRFRLIHAAATRAGGGAAALKMAGSFFFHFSAIWIALLVGGILMLDFGDAWKSMAEVQDYRGIGLTFFLGVAGAFLYLSGDLGKKVAPAPGEGAARLRLSVLGRTALFLLPCLGFAFALTGFLWFLLSGTDEVVHGDGAVLHVTVWAGFALFVGIFFGLLAKDAA